MQKVNYLTTAYEVAKKELPSSGFEFDKLWKNVAKILGMKQEDFKQELLGDFYTDLLQDGEFVFLGDNMWILRENITYEKYQKLRDSITDKNLNLSDAEYGGYEADEVNNLEDSNYDEEKELENNGKVADDELIEDDYDTELLDEDKTNNDVDDDELDENESDFEDDDDEEDDE